MSILSAPALPTSLPPSGVAGGDLDGTFPNPTLDAIIAATGPLGGATVAPIITVDTKGRVTALTSTTIAGVAPGGAAGGALAGTYPNPTLAYAATPIILGSDTATMDTGANGVDVTGNVLEIWIYARTDEAVTQSTLNVTVNADSGANYDLVTIRDVNTTLTGVPALAGTSWAMVCPGGSTTAGVFGCIKIELPAYAATVGNKAGIGWDGNPDQTAANTSLRVKQMAYRSTTAISRVTVTPLTGGAKLKTGSMLLCFKR